MRVIDLLNKIANGEKPEKFILHMQFEDFIYKLSNNGNYYEITTGEEFTESINLIFCLECLDVEVQIIEDKKIEKLEIVSFEKNYEYRVNCEVSFKDIVLKINEIIDKVNGQDK